ncbi:hypothetical protein E2986_06860 [Frieseomelitta varia]|uniref:Uncharacterized protein n=1 Tax=Frieseomelitta varia TaxID=561572 RepID=A0A833VZJ2_9HYME|nr:uncharacterized protein LOC122530065 isoform X1 [Frieseomelitta varia]KAF3426329.1 hypothetical protein E2986_06860 [Frieseomelitta varia]
MCSNNFEKLIIQARYLDDGIEKLITTWKLPHVLVGRFTECTAETNCYIDAVWNIIKNTENGVEQILSDIKNCKLENSIEELCQESKAEYETLKEQCDNLDSVFAEYGYQYDESNVSDETNINDTTNSDQNSVKETENLEVEFTPNLSWKYKSKHNVPLSNNITSTSSDSSIIHNYLCTPGRERPQEPIYSRHFYDILKK